MGRLDTTERRMRFSVLVTICTAELTADGRIRGKRTSSKPPTNRARSITEEFLNVDSDADSILRFTRKYGPLDNSFGRVEFEFDLTEWQNQQRKLRTWWDMFAHVHREKSTITSTVVEASPPACFRIRGDALTYECADLRQYMVLELAALPAERRRVCNREGCRNRFIARDLRDKYCSEACKSEQRNRAKLRYWNENKQKFLAERMKKRKAERGKKDVTRKTR